MPHSITLSKITWSTPDGHTLLSNLDLTLSGKNSVGVLATGAGLWALWATLTAAMTVRTALMSGRFRSGRWVNPDLITTS